MSSVPRFPSLRALPPEHKRRLLRVTAASLLGLALLVGGSAFWTFHSKNPSQIKKQIHRYLAKKSGQSRFEITLPDSLLNLDLKKNRRERPDRNVDGNRGRDGSRGRRGSPPLGEMTRSFQSALNDATDYKTIYRLIGEHLWAADQMLTQSDDNKKEIGVYLTMESGRAALDSAYDPWLAARIGEAYLWPQLAWAERGAGGRIDADYLLSAMEDAYRQADEPESVIRTLKQYLARLNQPERADMIRFRLARLLENEGRYQEALAYLHEMKPITNTNWQARVAFFEKRLVGSLNQK